MFCFFWAREKDGVAVPDRFRGEESVQGKPGNRVGASKMASARPGAWDDERVTALSCPHNSRLPQKSIWVADLISVRATDRWAYQRDVAGVREPTCNIPVDARPSPSVGHHRRAVSNSGGKPKQ